MCIFTHAVAETGRTWELTLEAVPLGDNNLASYRAVIGRWERERLNTGRADGRELWTSLQRAVRKLYVESGVMTSAFVKAADALVLQVHWSCCAFSGSELILVALSVCLPISQSLLNKLNYILSTTTHTMSYMGICQLFCHPLAHY